MQLDFLLAIQIPYILNEAWIWKAYVTSLLNHTSEEHEHYPSDATRGTCNVARFHNHRAKLNIQWWAHIKAAP